MNVHATKCVYLLGSRIKVSSAQINSKLPLFFGLFSISVHIIYILQCLSNYLSIKKNIVQAVN